MKHHDHEQRLADLYSYLDGEMDASQRSAFEARLDQDESLRRLLAEARGIEAVIKADAQPVLESVPPLSHPWKKAKPSEQSKAPSRLLWIAALLLVGVAVFRFLPSPPPALDGWDLYERYARQPRPAAVCDTPEKFAEYTLERFGTTIQADFGAPTQWVGWRGATRNYSPKSPESDPRLLLAKAGTGEPILVIFQPSSRADPTIGEAPGLYLHHKPFGSVEAWEVSPFQTPAALPSLTEAPR